MIYPAVTNLPRLLSRSASRRKTGNANAYIGSSYFVIQENLAAFAVCNDYARKKGKGLRTGRDESGKRDGGMIGMPALTGFLASGSAT
jgi:hypothetical protein